MSEVYALDAPQNVQLKAGDVSAFADSPAQVPASAYVNTFTPNTDQVSVNTGRAEVSQIENLSAVFSTPPEMLKPEGPNLLDYIIFGMVFFYLFRKGF